MPSSIVDKVAEVFRGVDLGSIQDFGIILEPRPAQGELDYASAVRLDGSCIGICSWAVRDLYKEGKRRLAESRRDVIAATAILFANPDFITAWAVRKEHIADTTFDNELAFCALILRRSPKSGETWAHRAWVLRQRGWDSMIASDELQVARNAATRAPNNYYAGVHRLRTLPFATPLVLSQELQRSRAWLQVHVGDSSGWWFHHALLERLGDYHCLDIDEEQRFIDDMYSRYSGRYECVRKYYAQWKKMDQAARSGQRSVPHCARAGRY